jgi:hypothetical protein
MGEPSRREETVMDDVDVIVIGGGLREKSLPAGARTGGSPSHWSDTSWWLASARTGVRAENLVRGPDQQSCLLTRAAVMITGHVPAVRLSPDHAGGLLAVAVSA